MSDTTMQDHAIKELIGALCCVDDWCTPAYTAVEVAKAFDLIQIEAPLMELLKLVRKAREK